VPDRRFLGRLAIAALALLCIAGWFGGLDWGPRVALGAFAAYAVIRVGIASFRPLSYAEERGPPVDVIDPDGGVPLYTCKGCGTQLVLLRKGNERPPRHCGEPMVFSVVAQDYDRPDTLAFDDLPYP
jgi:hypothetical protein